MSTLLRFTSCIIFFQIMSRKDIIMNKMKKPPKMKMTNIDAIYSRPYDFNDYPCIFVHKNEYESMRSSTYLMYNFQNIQELIDETRKFKPCKNITPPERQQRQNEKRQIVNVGFKYIGCVNENQVSVDLLHCNEELGTSISSNLRKRH